MPDNQRQRLIEMLEQMLLNGALAPGEKLPSQRRMVSEQSVARSTVREAVAELNHRGLLDTRHGGGSRVCNLLAAGFPEQVVTPEQASLSLQLQVLELREMLEGEAARYMAQRATDAERALLRAEFKRMRERAMGETTLRKAKADLTFHQLIARSSHHLLVISLSQLLYTRYFNVIYAVLEGNVKRRGRYSGVFNRQHGQIYEAIMARDGASARRLAQQHIAHSRQQLAEILGKNT